ncbi:M43 family zinc metalloprotease [Candidatus Nitrosocosmicus sp. R]
MDKEFGCGTEYYNSLIFSQNENNVLLIKEQYEQLINNSEYSVDDRIYRIHVVFHIIHHEEIENIDEKQIHEQLQVLNQDFRNKNIDNVLFSTYFREKKLAADSHIEFILADKDDYGNITNGITRTPTDKISFKAPPVGKESGNLPLKQQPVKSTCEGGKDAWDTAKYLNIWVCNLDGAGGYAQYPRRDPVGDVKATDGVVIDYHRVGLSGTAQPPFDKGRTLTHEIGHWLGLYHIWGPDDSSICNNDDSLDDTPPQRGPQEGRLMGYSEKHKCGGSDVYPLVMNHMDYWDDDFKLMFTGDQVALMYECLISLRRTLLE